MATDTKQIDDGGPAFPVDEYASSGMTLRDYFAAKAMQGLSTQEYNGTNWAKLLSEHAYEVADAMIAARKAGGE